MCGILALLGDEEISHHILEKLKILIDQRGPDYCSQVCDIDTQCKLKLKLKASVLHLRGDVMQEQPVIDGDGNALMFNGQLYAFSGADLPENLSDTSFLFDKLNLCMTKSQVADVFSAIDGPFAFVYWHSRLKTIFYGRDIFGRKSLCALVGEHPYPLIISSVAFHDPANDLKFSWHEVDCSGFHSIDLSQEDKPKLAQYMWNIDRVYPTTNKCDERITNPFTELVTLSSEPLLTLNDDPSLALDFDNVTQRLAVDRLEKILLEAISKRIKHHNTTCLNCRKATASIPKKCQHSKVAIAFSGGIDSTVLALGLHKVYNPDETIDLSTVAFKVDSPDRESVGSAFRELRKLCPSRNWRLVLCDVTKSELQLEREEVIRQLILPCKTVVDDSIGCGCWFISRAQGRSLDSLMGDDEFDQIFSRFLNYDPTNSNISSFVSNEMMTSDYNCPASIFFAGMSIDEQLGGYSSHRSAWSSSSSRGVYEEISFQMRRISRRNLGRDDRTCSHHGRDVKLPYLDFDLVSYLNQLPIGLKMDLDMPSSSGPKRLLRQLASRWGLDETSKRVKRALQFGTRIAKLEHSAENGNDICSRLI